MAGGGGGGDGVGAAAANVQMAGALVANGTGHNGGILTNGGVNFAVANTPPPQQQQNLSQQAPIQTQVIYTAK